MNEFENLKLIFAGDPSESWLVKITTENLETLRPFVERYAESKRYTSDLEPDSYFYGIDFISVRRVRADGSVGEMLMSYNLDESHTKWEWEKIC